MKLTISNDIYKNKDEFHYFIGSNNKTVCFKDYPALSYDRNNKLIDFFNKLNMIVYAGIVIKKM